MGPAFLRQNLRMFGLEDVDTFPGFQHDSLGRGCQDGDMPSTMHSEPVIDGEVEYESLPNLSQLALKGSPWVSFISLWPESNTLFAGAASG